MKAKTKIDQSERARQGRRTKANQPGLRHFFGSGFLFAIGYDHPLPFPHHSISQK
jgi:hypothetical protein